MGKKNNSKRLDEDIKKILKEEKTNIEPLDKDSLFSDLSAVSGNLTEAFSLLYPYKNQYIEDPNWKASLSQIRIAVSETLKKVNATMEMIGLKNDFVSKN